MNFKGIAIFVIVSVDYSWFIISDNENKYTMKTHTRWLAVGSSPHGSRGRVIGLLNEKVYTGGVENGAL